jgi:hypothetical protein
MNEGINIKKKLEVHLLLFFPHRSSTTGKKKKKKLEVQRQFY